MTDQVLMTKVRITKESDRWEMNGKSQGSRCRSLGGSSLLKKHMKPSYVSTPKFLEDSLNMIRADMRMVEKSDRNENCRVGRFFQTITPSWTTRDVRSLT